MTSGHALTKRQLWPEDVGAIRMKNLKTKKLSVILFLTLFVSLFTNVYLFWEVRSSARLPGLFNPGCWPNLRTQYPANGISTADLNDILHVFASLEVEAEDAGILQIQVFDSQHVLITTGHVEGPLSEPLPKNWTGC